MHKLPRGEARPKHFSARRSTVCGLRKGPLQPPARIHFMHPVPRRNVPELYPFHRLPVLFARNVWQHVRHDLVPRVPPRHGQQHAQTNKMLRVRLWVGVRRPGKCQVRGVHSWKVCRVKRVVRVCLVRAWPKLPGRGREEVLGLCRRVGSREPGKHRVRGMHSGPVCLVTRECFVRPMRCRQEERGLQRDRLRGMCCGGIFSGGQHFMHVVRARKILQSQRRRLYQLCHL